MGMPPVPRRAYAGPVRAIVSYALLRAALFVAPFALLLAAGVPWYVALAVAVLFAFAASAVFLRRQKEAVSAEIARRRGERGIRDDEDVEDEAVDGDREARAEGEDEGGPRATQVPGDASSSEAEDGAVATTTIDPDLVADDDDAPADDRDERAGR